MVPLPRKHFMPTASLTSSDGVKRGCQSAGEPGGGQVADIDATVGCSSVWSRYADSGVDDQGTHLYQTCPSGNLSMIRCCCYWCKISGFKNLPGEECEQARELGFGRSGGSRTSCSEGSCARSSGGKRSCSVAVVGKQNTSFRVLNAVELKQMIEGLESSGE